MQKHTFLAGVLVGTLLGLASALLLKLRPAIGAHRIRLPKLVEPIAPKVTRMPPTSPTAKPIPLVRPRLKPVSHEASTAALLASHAPTFEQLQPVHKMFPRHARDEKSLEAAKSFLAQLPIQPSTEISDAAPAKTGSLTDVLKVLETARSGGKPYGNTQYGAFTPHATPHAYFYLQILSELAGSDYVLTFRYLRVTRLAPEVYEYVEGKDRTLITHPAD